MHTVAAEVEILDTDPEPAYRDSVEHVRIIDGEVYLRNVWSEREAARQSRLRRFQEQR